MCKCVFTTWDVLHSINQKREKNKLESMSYETFMNHYRAIKTFLPPDDSIGPSYIFRKGKMEKITNSIWSKNYRRNLKTDWFAWKKVA